MKPDMSDDEFADYIIIIAFAILTICAVLVVVEWVR